MRIYVALFILILSFSSSFAQNDLNKLVETEKAFARTAAEKNTKTAFLEFMADDAIGFFPTPKNAKEVWNSRPVTPALLAWTPEFADIASNGVLGYTTGPWEYRPKGKNDAPAAFGHYVTLWQKQPDGNYKAVLDIGINHPPIALVNNWNSPNGSGKELNEKKYSASDFSAQFFEMADLSGLEKAYKTFAAEDIRLYRDGNAPFVGKKNSLNELKKFKNKVKFTKRSIFLSASDLAYTSNSYAVLDKDNKEIEKGNFLQIWKLRKGKWQIVLDLFTPLPKQ